jgi:LemA protein
MAVAEAYPDLKTTKSFQDFQAQIEGTENRINVARQDYNKSVEGYNLAVKRFPKSILAGIFGYKEKAFYKADAGTEKTPDIKFDIK